MPKQSLYNNPNWERVGGKGGLHIFEHILYPFLCENRADGNYMLWNYKTEQFVESGTNWEHLSLHQVEKYIRNYAIENGFESEEDEPEDDINTQDSTIPGLLEYTITEDMDTRDDSKLWVVKFTERMGRDEYLKTAATLKKIGGYWSKFKRGFIFRNNPADALINLCQ
jgi:hypothetical protein